MKTLHLAITVAFLVIATTHAASGQTNTAQTIHVFTDKDHYDAGDTIVVSGTATPEQYVQILVIDPNLLIQYKNVTYTDSVRNFTYKLTLPQFVKSGEWKIRATSGQDHVILSVPVGNKVRADPTELAPYTYEPGTPLKQFQTGVAAKDILCRPGLELIIQTQEGIPSCVRPLTAQILVARGLANDVIYNPVLAGSVTDLSAFKMEFSTDKDIVLSGKAIGINISLNNTSSIPLKIMPENAWAYQDLSLGEQCYKAPMGIAILDGYYTEQNMTQGKTLPIFAQYAVSCPVMTAAFLTQSFVFEPKSSHAFESTCNNGNEVCGGSLDETQHIEINGTWNNGIFQSFEPGIYTLIGGDEWGHLTIEHFTVVNSTSVSVLNQLSQIIPSCTSNILHQSVFAGYAGSLSCPAPSFYMISKILNYSGFAGVYHTMNDSSVIGPSTYTNPDQEEIDKDGNNRMGANLVLAPGHNGTIIYQITLHIVRCVGNCLPGITFPTVVNQTNIGEFIHRQGNEILYSHDGLDVTYTPLSESLKDNQTVTLKATVTASDDVPNGTYWLILTPDNCFGGPLVLLTVSDCEKAK
ncbi:MAG: hypothetical protein KGL95_15865 [Patescibacteria group bacterium]|nr:hypothetical protein [Patescibacteria group bacterium]